MHKYKLVLYILTCKYFLKTLLILSDCSKFFISAAHTCNLFSFVQNQSAASNNQSQDPDLSQRFQGPPQWLHLHLWLIVTQLWLVMMVYCDLWWWFIVNYDNGLLCLWHIIMPVMMFYCELWWFIVNWEGSVIRDRLVKRGGLGRFAECNTRQREELPSVKTKHSAKRPFSIILWTFFAECFGFAECIPMDTWQSDHKI